MKLIESFSVIKYSKFYLLRINTTERWLSYHRYSDNNYIIEEYNEEGNVVNSEDLFIDNFLPKDKSFLVFNSQEKDQITFLFLDRDNIVINRTKKAKRLGKSLEVKRFENYQEYIKTIKSKFNEKE